MPHQCLECGETFREGSVEILEGCPECDGTRFFHTDEGLDADERQDLRQETQETVKEAIQEALEDPDDDVWSWERREEWLRLEPDEARDILHDVVDDADAPDDEAPIPTPGDLPDGAPDPDDGTALSFPDADPTDPQSSPHVDGPDDDGPTTVKEAADPDEVDEAGDPDDTSRERIRAQADERQVPDDEADGVTPAQLANEARPDADESGPADDPDPTPVEDRETADTPDPTVDPTAETGPPEPAAPETPSEGVPEEPPEALQDPSPSEAGVPASSTSDDGQVSTVNVEEPGRYEVDVESLLDTSPVIIEKDGHYMVHLPSIFSSVDDERAR